MKKFHDISDIGDIKHCEKCGSPTLERNVIKVTIGGSDLEYFLCVEHSVQLMCIMGKVLEDYLPGEVDKRGYTGVMH